MIFAQASQLGVNQRCLYMALLISCRMVWTVTAFPAHCLLSAWEFVNPASYIKALRLLKRYEDECIILAKAHKLSFFSWVSTSRAVALQSWCSPVTCLYSSSERHLPVEIPELVFIVFCRRPSLARTAVERDEGRWKWTLEAETQDNIYLFMTLRFLAPEVQAAPPLWTAAVGVSYTC